MNFLPRRLKGKRLRRKQVKTLVVALVFIIIGFTAGFAERLAVLPELARPERIEIDGDELYVIEGVETFIFSLKDYRLLKRFGREGQGPGELIPHPERGILVELANGNIFLNSYNKVACYSKCGALIREKLFPFYLLQFIPCGKNYVVVKFSPGSEGDRTIDACLYDSEFSEVRVFHSSKRTNPFKTRRVEIPPPHLFIRCYGRKIFVLDKVKGFHIDIFDVNGKPIRAINLDWERVKVTRSFKKDVILWFRTQPHLRTVSGIEEMIEFPDYLPPARNFFVDSGKIYVQTYKRKNGLSEFVILDFKGKVLGRIFLPGGYREVVQVDPNSIYTIKDNACYYLKECEKTERWELRRERIDSNFSR
jgi:hypothetical protein